MNQQFEQWVILIVKVSVLYANVPISRHMSLFVCRCLLPGSQLSSVELQDCLKTRLLNSASLVSACCLFVVGRKLGEWRLNDALMQQHSTVVPCS